MSYAQYFEAPGYEIATGTRDVVAKWTTDSWTENFNYVKQTGGLGVSKEFEQAMAGHDATSKNLTNTLKSIYDGYAQYAEDYEGQVQPLIDALGGDIEGMEGYIKDYNKLLEDNKDSFLNGIILDPNANRTRAKYTGAVAEQYDNAKDSMRRDMISQGLNPYENKGAARDLELNRARDIGLASGQAYTDWREGYNRDKQAQQQATGQFIGLNAAGMDAQGKIMEARKGLGDFYGNIMSSKIGAGQAKAAGYENLASLEEARRAETLGLQQQASENQKYAADIKQQLDAKITSRDKNARYGTQDAYGNRYLR